jgi:lysine-N-methylase
LDETGLCRIITELGEDYLCEICREHPRFYHDNGRGREVGLGMACEEACRLILTSDGYAELTPIGEVMGEADADLWDVLPARERIFSILSDRSVPYGERRERLCREFDVWPARHSDGEWRERLARLEYLNDAHREWFAVYSSDAEPPSGMEEALERALAYFVFRHVAEVWDGEELRAKLGFCFVCERLLCSMARAAGAAKAEALIPLAVALSEELEYSEENTEAICWEFLGTDA